MIWDINPVRLNGYFIYQTIKIFPFRRLSEYQLFLSVSEQSEFVPHKRALKFHYVIETGFVYRAMLTVSLNIIRDYFSFLKDCCPF
jgi:hypothetical protein